MTADPQVKIDPERLELRAKPRPVTRISRKVLYAGSALVLIFISGAVLIALDPPDWKDGQRTELIDARRNQTPEGIEKLPSSYDGIPKLGPPNPGDLGKSITQLERDLNIQPRPLPSFKPDPEEEFRRAERIRLAKLAAKANASGVFFTIRARQVSTNAKSDQSDNANTDANFDPLAVFNALNQPPPTATTVDPNGQNGKLAFLQNGPDGKIYNQHTFQKPVSPYQLMAGTVIAASLITGLNSDLPGTVIAQVTEHTYDSVTGQHLLIPQGSRLIGRYDSNISFGQNRALVIWQRIIRPDGTSIVIDNLPGTDPAGFAGVADRVDFHTRQLVKSIGLATLLGVGTELSFGSNENELVRAIRESIQENTNRAGQRIVERTLDIQPTITVRPGWPIRVIVNKDIILPPMIVGVR
ncbi:MAG: TrbI/VirB10 family protein [Rhizobiales bacterium]|nr:TrbI/VirB10 family protein [Hyphomicrobiales bacterium]